MQDFESQLRELFKLENFSKVNGIVYKWKSERPIPRLNGKSNVLYIGRTKHSFASRYSQRKVMAIELTYFETVYSHLIKRYRKLSIEVI